MYVNRPAWGTKTHSCSESCSQYYRLALVKSSVYATSTTGKIVLDGGRMFVLTPPNSWNFAKTIKALFLLYRIQRRPALGIALSLFLTLESTALFFE